MKRRVLVCVGVLAALPHIALAQSATAQKKPIVKPSPQPKAITYAGFVRGYYFTRTNATGYGLPQTKVLNQATYNTAINLHGAYALSSHWSIGATYLYANPANGCQTTAAQLQSGGPCSGKMVSTGNQPTNPDNTLPGFALSTAYEAYIKYADSHLSAKIGNQLLATPWANGADTRLKPAAYQGVDVTDKFTQNWSAEAAYIDRYESRVDSAFLRSTLLTATNMADAPGPGANLPIPRYSARPSNGFAYFRYGYTSASFTANLYVYGFLDIANAQWFDAKWLLRGPSKPFVALQAGNEAQSGKALIGKIDSQVLGLQAGFSLSRTLDVTVGGDYIPQKTQTLRSLPAGVSCKAGNQIAVAGPAPLMMFLPSGGTPDCVMNADGSATVFYGGWASPYTDSYTSDPLYTTSMTGGMVERRSSGISGKAAATWYGFTRRVRLIAAFAMYRYGNAATGIAPSHETDLDGTLYFSRVQPGAPYHGFSLRHRYGDRDMDNTALYGGLPVFKYNRTQLEYDF